MANSRILVISDTHCPYHHPDTIKFLTAIKAKYKPDRVIHIGDELDNHAMSYHEVEPTLYSAGEELKKGREVIWQMESLFPTIDVMESNHGSLAFRKAKTSGIPKEFMKDYSEVLKTKKWKWHDQLRLTLPNGQECLFAHGLGANYLLTAQKRGMSLIQGHYHSKYGIAYWSTNNDLNFGMNVGCLIDDKSLAFAYNKTTVERPIIGCGMIIDSQPKLIPLVMKSNGRWNGRLT